MTLILPSLLASIKDGTPKQECKGNVYRVREYSFFRKIGIIMFQREYVPMKKLSCPGCERCEYLTEDMNESDFKVIHGGDHGDLVRLTITNEKHDWETGYIDTWDLEFVKVNT